MRLIAAAIVSLTVFASAAMAESWVADPVTGYKIWNDEINSSDDVATWSGGCRDGVTTGIGVPKWIEPARVYRRLIDVGYAAIISVSGTG